MGEQVDCLFCREGATRRAEGSSMLWECPHCGEYWTAPTVVEIPSWETAFLTVDRLRDLQGRGIGAAQRPIMHEDLGL